tara:strand:+ start:370 stop:1101 length:732 start_codon:yes stop_codon:yes gene_type:complete
MSDDFVLPRGVINMVRRRPRRLAVNRILYPGCGTDLADPILKVMERSDTDHIDAAYTDIRWLPDGGYFRLLAGWERFIERAHEEILEQLSDEFEILGVEASMVFVGPDSPVHNDLSVWMEARLFSWMREAIEIGERGVHRFGPRLPCHIYRTDTLGFPVSEFLLRRGETTVRLRIGHVSHHLFHLWLMHQGWTLMDPEASTIVLRGNGGEGGSEFDYPDHTGRHDGFIHPDVGPLDDILWEVW